MASKAVDEGQPIIHNFFSNNVETIGNLTQIAGFVIDANDNIVSTTTISGVGDLGLDITATYSPTGASSTIDSILTIIPNETQPPPDPATQSPPDVTIISDGGAPPIYVTTLPVDAQGNTIIDFTTQAPTATDLVDPTLPAPDPAGADTSIIGAANEALNAVAGTPGADNSLSLVNLYGDSLAYLDNSVQNTTGLTLTDFLTEGTVGLKTFIDNNSGSAGLEFLKSADAILGGVDLGLKTITLVNDFSKLVNGDPGGASPQDLTVKVVDDIGETFAAVVATALTEEFGGPGTGVGQAIDIFGGAISKILAQTVAGISEIPITAIFNSLGAAQGAVGYYNAFRAAGDTPGQALSDSFNAILQNGH